ncbi:NUDIX domain-containing protein [Streptomyces sp. NPDC088725]|uniref:NUDIX domain-containing protein n=1 Tax=Streptomyces sp. NPDC088725 TaxID=3365873 RepID=UPI00381F827B
MRIEETIEESVVVKELNSYLLHFPDETPALMPLFDTLLDHARQGDCLHDGLCPIVKAGAVLVNEGGRALALKRAGSWVFAEGDPSVADHSLSRTAVRILAEAAGACDVWTIPGAEHPLLIDISPADPEDGRRTRYGFRYLFRAHSGVLFPAEAPTPSRTRWVPLEEIGHPLLRARLRATLTDAP